MHFKIWCLYLRCIFSHAFSNKNSASEKYRLAGKSLFSLSFRYLEKDKKSPVFFFKCFFRAILFHRILVNGASTRYSEGGKFFYDISSADQKNRTTYLNYFLKHSINGGIWKQDLSGYLSFFDKIAQLFLLSVLFLILSPIALFSSLPASLALIFTEYIETVNLIKVAKKNDVKALYYFCIYEKDANITALALQNTGIKVIKIPSEVPLYFWNKTILADKLIICDSNQLEEVQLYKETILVKETEFWGPERCVETIERYKVKETRDKANNKTIGFYSTASYIRDMEGHIVQGNMLEQENNLKSILAEYLKTHSVARLVIFLHPKEKAPKYAETVKNHYLKYFESLNYTLFSAPESSSYHFEMVELGISFFSTVMYERLFFGFKCLLFGSPNVEFPIPGSALYNICANDKSTILSKIDLFLKQGVDEYFKYNGIKKSPFFESL